MTETTCQTTAVDDTPRFDVRSVTVGAAVVLGPVVARDVRPAIGPARRGCALVEMPDGRIADVATTQLVRAR